MDYYWATLRELYVLRDILTAEADTIQREISERLEAIAEDRSRQSAETENS